MPGFPNRCQHLKINVTQCGSPALRRNRFCFFHKRFQDERIKLSADRARRGVATFVLPILEDANSIQIALIQVMRLILTQQIDHKTASLLLYALQTASTNLRLTEFKPFRHEVILDPREAAATVLGENVWRDHDFDEEEDDDQEEETEADRAIAALEAAQKKKDEDAKWRRWAEGEADRLQREGRQERQEQERQDQRSQDAIAAASITEAGSAVLAPASSNAASPSAATSPMTTQKKPAASLNPAQIREQIAAMVREEFFPNLPDQFVPKKQPTNEPGTHSEKKTTSPKA
jgi:hypothetical protein